MVITIERRHKVTQVNFRPPADIAHRRIKPSWKNPRLACGLASLTGVLDAADKRGSRSRGANHTCVSNFSNFIKVTAFKYTFAMI